MPSARHNVGLVTAPNGRILAIGGQSATDWSNVVEEYDPQQTPGRNELQCQQPAKTSACR
jgi:Kelch motif